MDKRWFLIGSMYVRIFLYRDTAGSMAVSNVVFGAGLHLPAVLRKKEQTKKFKLENRIEMSFLNFCKMQQC